MRLLLVATFIGLGMACVSRDPSPRKTQVYTYPDGALVEFNGKPVGRAPAAVVLPQDTNGKLTEKIILRAVPNSAQHTLYAQTRTLDPAARTERIPDRIMIDMTLRGTNPPAVATPTTHVESASATNKVRRARAADRSKPTQPVGIDRWSPGIY